MLVKAIRDVDYLLFENFNCIFLESIDFTISEAGGTVTGSLEQEGGGDLTQRFSDGYTTLDCTAPQCTINLTAFVGTNAVPKEVFVYILQSGKTTLVASNSDWPAAEHIKVANLLLKSATTTGTDNGALINRNWNDHTQDDENLGHVTNIAERMRWEPAAHKSGTALTIKDAAGASLPTGNSSTAIELVVATGQVFQLHEHTYPAVDMFTGDDAHVINQVTDEGGAYATTTDLVTDITVYDDGTASGTAIGNNKYFNLVIWGVQNRTGEESHLMINIPTGQYTGSSNAQNDVDALSVYNIPVAFRGTGFLIARITMRLIAGAQWTYIAQEDLRGLVPSSSAGVAVSATDHALLANLVGPADDHTQYVLADGTRTVTGVLTVEGIGDGGRTNYDLKVGDTATPDYGMIQFGNAVIGRTSYKAGNIDLDGSILFQNIGGPVTSEIEFCFATSTGASTRFALAKAAVGNASYHSRSMLIAGPAPADTDYVKVSYWQGQGIFDNLVCDTAGDGADLGIQNDLEVEGDIFTDSIKESTAGSGTTFANNVTITGTLNSIVITGVATDNIGMGDTDTLSNITTGDRNIAIGPGAGEVISGGDDNICLGLFAGRALTTESDNILIGPRAGQALTGSSNLCFGAFSGGSATTADRNIFIGDNSGFRQTTNDDLLIIDNRIRASVAEEATNAILHGTMAATTAAQSLSVNAGTFTLNAGVDTDLTMNFTGTTNSGVLKWMEDEDYFQFADAVVMDLTLAITGNLTMTGNIIIPGDGTIGQAAGPLMTFDDTNNFLEITGIDGLGIGTSSPDEFVDVETALATTLFVRVNNTNDPVRPAGFNMKNIVNEWSFTVTTAGNWVVRDVTGGNNVFAITDGAPAQSLLVTADGDTVISGTSASAKLHVDQLNPTRAIPVLYLDQADVDKPFIMFEGSSAAADLTRNIVDNGDVTTPTLVGWVKNEVLDLGNQITDQEYFQPLYTLA